MSTSEVISVVGSLLAVMAICSLPIFGSLHGAGPRYRAALKRELGFAWGVATIVVCWLALGWFALDAGGRWFGTYRDFTLILMGMGFALLPFAIRSGNQTLAAAMRADRGLTA
jgi:hypothetical protein